MKQKVVIASLALAFAFIAPSFASTSSQIEAKKPKKEKVEKVKKAKKKRTPKEDK